MSKLLVVVITLACNSVRIDSVCSTKPPVWPNRFKAFQRKIPDNDLNCTSGTCSNVTMYYDWKLQGNLIIDDPDTRTKVGALWDLELGNHHSYYFHPSVNKCMFHEFPVGILRPDWLNGASYLGESTIRGRRVHGWTKVDFIDYYADVNDCTPVSWHFHSMKTSFDTVDFFEDEAVDASLFTPPIYCPNQTGTNESVDRVQQMRANIEEQQRYDSVEFSMRICKDRSCSADCKMYKLPNATCYNPSQLFPGDTVWSSRDVEDVANATHVRRSFFGSRNASCGEREDVFEIPLNQCVGPFGAPRPWGMFELVPLVVDPMVLI